MIRTSVFFLMILLASCTSRNGRQNETGSSAGESPGDQAPAVAALSSFQGPAELLLKQLKEQGDYVNSRQYPSMIKPATVYEELGGNLHIVDLRTSDRYGAGHIKGAVNIQMSGLLAHFEDEIIPFKFDKIILVDDGGQRSSFATNLLRLMGYGNVYSMRWGMSGWNSDFSGNLRKNILSARFEDRLETGDVNKPDRAVQPGFATTAETGEDILKERVATLLKSDDSELFVSCDDVFADPDKYYVVNWERRDKYESGHIPGAIRYKPQGTLGIPAEMGTLPTDKTIVLYCGTGMSSAFASAYLRLFGYDARSLIYGNNSFMHEKMLADRVELSWQPFTAEIQEDFPYEK